MTTSRDGAPAITLLPNPDPRDRLREFVDLSKRKFLAHDAKGRYWKRLNYVFGGLAAAASALAGVTILTEWWTKDVAGTVAVAAGVLTALVGFYDFDGRNVTARLARAEWRLLHQDALSLQHQAPRLGEDDLRGQVDALYRRCFDLEAKDAESRKQV